MTPVQDYDSNSLKRRNPRQMFTDSAFYSPKFHPSVADQVELAHKLSSSLYHDVNKMSKGQEMYLKRAKKSGEDLEPEPEIPRHDNAPNLKLVMNPEGKVQDWQDLPEEEVPDMDQVAMVGNPEIAKVLVEGMNNCKGRGGELFAKRRKKADKWVIDENQIGMGAHPSQFADEFMAQQTMAQQSVHEEKAMEIRAQQDLKDEVDAQQKAEQQEFQQQQQQIFQEQQLMKQQQSMQIKQMRKPSVDLPPGFEACSLKGRPFTPSLDLSCHNVQGINVWANKGPKPYGKASSNLRTTPLSAQQPAQTKPATLAENDVEPEPPISSMAKPIPVDEQVPQFESPPKEEVDFQQMKSQMEQHQLKQSSSAAKVSSSQHVQQSQQVQQTQQVQQIQQVQQTQQIQQTQQVQQNQQSIPAASQAQQDELAEKKRKEYEEWLRTQEMEA